MSTLPPAWYVGITPTLAEWQAAFLDAKNGTAPTTVAGLGAPLVALRGVRWAVTDALNPIPGQPLVGGGSVVTGAFCTGSAWINL